MTDLKAIEAAVDVQKPVKRYNIHLMTGGGYSRIQFTEADDGEYVLASDYTALLTLVEGVCRERDGMRGVLSTIADPTICEDWEAWEAARHYKHLARAALASLGKLPERAV